MIESQNGVQKTIAIRKGVATKHRLSPIAITATILLACAAVLPSQAKAQMGGPVIDNDQVKVVDITLAPGKPITMNHGDRDTVMLFLAGGKVRTTVEGKESVAERHPGDAVFEGKASQESVEAVSPSAPHVIVVELKRDASSALPNKSGDPLAFPRPGSKTVLENHRVLVSDYTFKLGEKTRMHFHDKDAVVVFRDNGVINSIAPDGVVTKGDDQAGQVKFNPAGRLHSEELVSGKESVIALEIK